MLAKNTGKSLPMLIPITMGATMLKVILPEAAATACTIPTAADELWSIMARSIPSAKPIKGLVNVVNASWKDSDVFNGSRAVSMVVIPKKRIPKPSRMEAMSLGFFFLLMSMINAPIPIIRGAKDEGLSIPSSVLPPPLTSPRRSI